MGMMDIPGAMINSLRDRMQPQAAMPTSVSPAAPTPSMAYNEGPGAFSPLPSPTAPSTGSAATGSMSLPTSASAYGTMDV